MIAPLSSAGGRLLTGAAVVCLLVGWAYLAGRRDQAAIDGAAALRSQVAALRRDLDAAKASEADAARRAADVDAIARTLAGKVSAYEAELAAAPSDGRCALSPRDVERLRAIAR